MVARSGRDADQAISSMTPSRWRTSPGTVAVGQAMWPPAPTTPVEIRKRVDEESHRDGGGVPSAGDEAIEEGAHRGGRGDMERLRVEARRELDDRVRRDLLGSGSERVSGVEFVSPAAVLS